MKRFIVLTFIAAAIVFTSVLLISNSIVSAQNTYALNLGTATALPEYALAPLTTSSTVTPPIYPIGSIRLLAPIDGSNGRERQTFEWSADFMPGPNQGFELIFWHPGQDPLQQGFGLAAPTSDTSITVNLDELDITLGPLFDRGYYRWGVFLVEQVPYKRISLLDTKRQPETRSFLFTSKIRPKQSNPW